MLLYKLFVSINDTVLRLIDNLYSFDSHSVFTQLQAMGAVFMNASHK